YGELIAKLADISAQNQDHFEGISLAFAGRDDWYHADNVTDLYGEELIEDLAQMAAEDELGPSLVQRILDACGNTPEAQAARWIHEQFLDKEDWLRSRVDSAVATGRMNKEIGLAIGYVWGVLSELEELGGSSLQAY